MRRHRTTTTGTMRRNGSSQWKTPKAILFLTSYGADIMRKIEKVVVGAFVNGRAATLSNTTTDGSKLYLHGNLIAKRENGVYFFTLAGWNTPTTRSRINALARLAGGTGVHCKDWTAYHGTEEISDRLWYQL